MRGLSKLEKAYLWFSASPFKAFGTSDTLNTQPKILDPDFIRETHSENFNHFQALDPLTVEGAALNRSITISDTCDAFAGLPFIVNYKLANVGTMDQDFIGVVGPTLASQLTELQKTMAPSVARIQNHAENSTHGRCVGAAIKMNVTTAAINVAGQIIAYRCNKNKLAGAMARDLFGEVYGQSPTALKQNRLDAFLLLGLTGMAICDGDYFNAAIRKANVENEKIFYPMQKGCTARVVNRNVARPFIHVGGNALNTEISEGVLFLSGEFQALLRSFGLAVMPVPATGKYEFFQFGTDLVYVKAVNFDSSVTRFIGIMYNPATSTWNSVVDRDLFHHTGNEYDIVSLQSTVGDQSFDVGAAGSYEFQEIDESLSIMRPSDASSNWAHLVQLDSGMPWHHVGNSFFGSLWDGIKSVANTVANGVERAVNIGDKVSNIAARVAPIAMAAF